MRTKLWPGFGTTLVGAALLASPAAGAEDTTPPTVPSNLHTVSATDRDLVLAWDASTDDSGAVNYAVFVDDNPTPILTSATPELDVHLNRAIGMIPGSTHTFQVRAEDPSGNHSFSNVLTASFAPGDNTPPTPPSNLHVVSNTSDQIELAWDASMDESDLEYFVTGAPCTVQTTQTQIAVATVTFDPVCGLSPGSTYTFSVRAHDELDNTSDASDPITVTVALS